MRTRFSRTFWSFSVGIALILSGGVAAGPATATGMKDTSTAHSATDRRPIAVPASGSIVVRFDPTTLSATPMSRTTCRVRIEAAYDLGGTVNGTATGVTRATVNAPCADATSAPLGTYTGAFVFTGTFRGKVAGVPAMGRLESAGVTRGGAVSAALALQSEVHVVAAIRASAGEGRYRGIAVIPASH